MHGLILYNATFPKENGGSLGWLHLDTPIVHIPVLNPGTRTRSCDQCMHSSSCHPCVARQSSSDTRQLDKSPSLLPPCVAPLENTCACAAFVYDRICLYAYAGACR